jgi:hypothetical protein
MAFETGHGDLVRTTKVRWFTYYRPDFSKDVTAKGELYLMLPSEQVKVRDDLIGKIFSQLKNSGEFVQISDEQYLNLNEIDGCIRVDEKRIKIRTTAWKKFPLLEGELAKQAAPRIRAAD